MTPINKACPNRYAAVANSVEITGRVVGLYVDRFGNSGNSSLNLMCSSFFVRNVILSLKNVASENLKLISQLKGF